MVVRAIGGPATGPPAIGVAYSDHVFDLISNQPDLADFVEVPFEMLVRSPTVLKDVVEHKPIVLHCASLSLAGNRPPPPELLHKLKQLATDTKTPWIGEHLAFIRCGAPASGHDALVSAQGTGTTADQYDVGYTVSPQLSEQVAQRVLDAIERYECDLDAPLIVENGPLYFPVPGSTFSQVDFIRHLCSCRPAQRLLLDIAHLEITCNNFGADAREALLQLPLDRVDEIHISGYSQELSVWWDNHSRAAQESTFELLRLALSRCSPRAITLEYNWGASVPFERLHADLERVRSMALECYQSAKLSDPMRDLRAGSNLSQSDGINAHVLW
jgi:uncharacterized protein